MLSTAPRPFRWDKVNNSNHLLNLPIMKTKAALCSIACIVCLTLAFSYDSLIESRLFVSLSIVSGLLCFRFASMPMPVTGKQKEAVRQPAHSYEAQEAQVEHV